MEQSILESAVLGLNRIPMDSKSKGKGKKGQDKGKGKGDQGKGRKVANVESDTWAQEQQPAASSGDQPEPEITALFALEDTMPPKSEARDESSRRGRSPRRAKPSSTFKEHCDQERYRHGSERFGISFWV